MSVNVKYSLLLLLTVLSLPALLSAQNHTDIEKIMTEAESQGLSVVYNTNGRTLPLIFNPLSKLITAVKPTTVLKIGFLYTTTLYFLTFLFPTAFGMKARSNSLMSSFDYDFDSISNSMNDMSERVSNYFQIPEPECRYRAVCETSTYIATKIPAVSDWAKKVSGAFFLNLANPYSKAWINGMMTIDCATTYYQCFESPFKVFLDKFVAKK